MTNTQPSGRQSPAVAPQEPYPGPAQPQASTGTTGPASALQSAARAPQAGTFAGDFAPEFGTEDEKRANLAATCCCDACGREATTISVDPHADTAETYVSLACVEHTPPFAYAFAIRRYAFDGWARDDPGRVWSMRRHLVENKDYGYVAVRLIDTAMAWSLPPAPEVMVG